MRRRRPASCSSGTEMWKGRISLSSAAAAECTGRNPVKAAAAAPTPAAPTKRSRRDPVRLEFCIFMAVLLIVGHHTSRASNGVLAGLGHALLRNCADQPPFFFTL